MLKQRVVEACTPWIVERTEHLYELLIKEGAEIRAPEGKFLTLSVNGYGRKIEPGYYKGDIVMAVTDYYEMPAHGLKLNFAEMFSMIRGEELDPETLRTPTKAVAVIRDNKVIATQTNPSVIQNGSVGDHETEGVYIASTEDDLCGIVVEGDSKYTIKNSRFDMEGNGHDDWLGLGTAVSACDNAEVLIDNCQFHFAGVTRCTLQAGMNSKVTVRNSRFINMAPDGTDWVGNFSWQCSLRGHNRLTQLSDNADVLYDNCFMHSNGWGLCSIDGTGDPKPRSNDPAEWPKNAKPGYAVTMTLKDCDMTLTGPRQHGYGAFCIGDNHITMDHTRCDVNGMPVLLMGMEGKGRFDVLNGSYITGRRFGASILNDDNSVLNIVDSTFNTGKSSICLRGSSTIVNIKNSEMIAGNGTVVQLMDCDEAGMDQANFIIPVNERDVKDESRDLTRISATEDVTINLTDDTICGNFYNSTTNIRAFERASHGTLGKLHEYVLGVIPPAPEGAPSPVMARHNGNDLRGAINLGINLKNSTVTGVISSACQAYREGLYYITSENMDELANVTQTAAPTVNNGVVVTLDATSVWNVTDTSYLTALSIADGAHVVGVDGKPLTMTVNGIPTTIAPGTYSGTIVLSL